MAKRDPHEVLGVARDADAAHIKAAWRKLARAHHPDLTGDDPAASRVATRKMAEINNAYAALIRDIQAAEAERGPAADMPHFIRAAEAYATLGEMCGVLRGVFGEYREPVAV